MKKNKSYHSQCQKLQIISFAHINIGVGTSIANLTLTLEAQ